MKLSLVMIAKNSEETIGRSLRSVKDLVDEMVVVDTGSTDYTRDIAVELGARVSVYEWRDDFAAARNFALSQANGDYAFVLDSDEWVTAMDRYKIDEAFSGNPFIGRIRRTDCFQNNRGEKKYYVSYISRWIPKNTKYTGRVHEQVVSDLPRQRIPVDVYHVGYLGSDKSERNIPLLLEEIKSSPQNPYLRFQLEREYRNSKQFELAAQQGALAYPLLSGKEEYYPNFIVDWAYSLIELKQWELALEVFAQEQSRLEDFPDFWFAYGWFCMSYGEVNSNYLRDIPDAFLRCIELGESTKYGTVVGTGSFLAMYNLGAFHQAMGDLRVAREWYKRAADMGYEAARARL